MQVYEFNVPTFGKGVVFDVDHKVSQSTIFSLEQGAGDSIYLTVLPHLPTSFLPCRYEQSSSDSLQRP